jgi:hypothetical protein
VLRWAARPHVGSARGSSAILRSMCGPWLKIVTASMLAGALVAACGGFSGDTEGPALPDAGDAALPVDAKALDTGLVVTDAGVDAAAECEQL